MKLSDQALGALMMALQKSLVEQSDIVPVLKGLQFQEGANSGELIISNPPTFKIDNDTSEQDVSSIRADGSD